MKQNIDDDEVHRVARQSVLYEAVKKASGINGAETAADLICVCIRLLAEDFPGDLDDAAKKQITENYHKATDALMKERAMSPSGVHIALTLCEQLGRISLDYSPGSSFVNDMKKDAATKENQENIAAYGEALQAAYDKAVSQGMSRFGATATMVLAGTAFGGRAGVGHQKLARALIDGLLLSSSFAKKAQPLKGTKEYEELVEQAISEIAQQMGISKAAARKYAVYVEQQIRDGQHV